MLLFEVHDDGPRPGFRLTLRSGYAGVPMGYDEKAGGDTWLPLGNSIRKALTHTDDQDEEFVLTHAHLEQKNIGFVLTCQTEQEAALEKRALVLIESCTDPSIGVTTVAEAYGRTMPEFVLETDGGGHARRLYIFQDGDALYISWPAASIESNRPRRFIVTWDAAKQQLVESPVYRSRKQARPPVQQQRQRRQVEAPTELRAE